MLRLLKVIWKDNVFSNVFSGIVLMLLGYFFVSNDKVQENLNEAYLRLVAPGVVRYSKEFMQKVASEIKSGTCPNLTELVIDYSVMRDQSRVLKGETFDKE